MLSEGMITCVEHFFTRATGFEDSASLSSYSLLGIWTYERQRLLLSNISALLTFYGATLSPSLRTARTEIIYILVGPATVKHGMRTYKKVTS